MFRADDYVKVSDLAEAYELCQKRSSLVVGGMVWMKMTHITKRTIVDLSGLGLDAIEEKEGEFSIGCMCSLRQLETHEGLNRYFDGIFRECTRNIVGVQMRNCATVGGSIFARFGFSDILTCLLALDAYVELYHEGTIPLSEFAARPVRRDQKDILVRIIIKKDGRKAAYTSQRNSRTDFPVIACCVSNLGNKWFVSVGARPAKAKAVIITEDDFDTLKEMAKEAAELAKELGMNISFDSDDNDFSIVDDSGNVVVSTKAAVKNTGFRLNSLVYTGIAILAVFAASVAVAVKFGLFKKDDK